MSLINEALKKAQPERPGTPPPSPQPHHLELPPQKPPKRKRSYLWGFLLAVIIVGLFSTMVTAFLVYQILGVEEGESTKAASAEVESSEEPAGQVWEKLPEAESATAATVQPDGSQPDLAVAQAEPRAGPVDQAEDAETLAVVPACRNWRSGESCRVATRCSFLT